MENNPFDSFFSENGWEVEPETEEEDDSDDAVVANGSFGTVYIEDDIDNATIIGYVMESPQNVSDDSILIDLRTGEPILEDDVDVDEVYPPNKVSELIKVSEIDFDLVSVSHEGTYVVGWQALVENFYDLPTVILGYTKYKALCNWLFAKGFTVAKATVGNPYSENGIQVKTISFVKFKD